MGKRILIVVDVQNDFVSGTLGTKEAQDMLPNLINKIKNFKGEIILTQDSHTDTYLETQEGKMLPVKHCIVGTNGWQFASELEAIREKEEYRVYQKNTFGSTDLANDLKKENLEKPIEYVELVGLCTDICIVTNALMIKAYLPEVPIYVDTNCCAGVSKENHFAALKVMESCQIRLK